MLRPYRLLGTVPYATTLMATSLLGRLQMPAIPLVMTFLIVDWTGSYAIGGVVSATMTVGHSISGPLRGRAADRSSAPRLLLITGGSYAAGLGLLPVLTGWLEAGLWGLILPVAFATGLATPPVTQLGRSMWPRIAGSAAREAAYAVEATLQELLFVVAPVIAASTVAFYGPEVAVLSCAVWALLGPATFAMALWRAGLRTAPPVDRHRDSRPRALLHTPGFVRLVGFGVLFVGGLVGTDLILVSWARDRGTPALAGVLAAVWAIGSLLGGLLLGGSAKPPRLWLRATAAAAGLLLLIPLLPPLANPASPILVCVVLVISGSAIAPSLAAANSLIGVLAPGNRRGEAFGWFATAHTAGGTLAAPVVGSLLDLAGPAAATGITGAMVALAAFLVWHRSLSRSRAPDEAEQGVPI